MVRERVGSFGHAGRSQGHGGIETRNLYAILFLISGSGKIRVLAASTGKRPVNMPSCGSP
jgi:hypothetical protein